MNTVIFEPGRRLLVHRHGTIRVPPEVLAQSEDGNPYTVVTQWARKLGILARGESLTAFA